MGTSRSFKQFSLLLLVTLFLGSSVGDIIYSNDPGYGDFFGNLESYRIGLPIGNTGWYYNNVVNGSATGINIEFPRSGSASVLLYTPDKFGRADIEYLGKGAVNASGNYYSITKLGTFKSLEKFSYEWLRDNRSSVPIHLHPVLRVLLDADGNLATTGDRGGLVFERSYNPPATVTNDKWTKDTVTKHTKLGSFGLGKNDLYDLDNNGNPYDSTLADWKSASFLKNAVVIGFSSGAGLSWDGEFGGAVDNIAWTFSTTTTNNFEVGVGNSTGEPSVPHVPECALSVFKDGCYYPGTCVRKWGECPELDICNGVLELSTSQKCQPACVGFGVFANCPVDISKYNQLVFGAKIVSKGGVNKCVVHAKLELEDEQCNKYCIYVWITNECCDYSIVLAKFKCLNLCKITGLFLLTAFDLISYDDCNEVVLVIDYIKFIYKPCYTVFDECCAYQYNRQCSGPIVLYYWPCLPCPNVLSNCEGYGRVLVIPCDAWGVGLCGYSQNLKEFKYLSFSLKSTVKVKVEVGDSCGNKACVYVDSTCGHWQCFKLCLDEFCGVDLCDVTWQFMATKCGSSCNNEVKIANIKYIY